VALAQQKTTPKHSKRGNGAYICVNMVQLMTGM